MSRVKEALDGCRQEGRLAFIPYLTVGDPDLQTTVSLVRMLEEEGADLVELGVPFSDPVADGTTNQRAARRALAAGVTLTSCLETAAEIRTCCRIPLVLFSYFNPIFRMGLDHFPARAARSGIDAVLVTDLPPEEAEAYRRSLMEAGLAPIFMVSPTSGAERARLVAEATRGFIYYVSRAGVTGARSELPAGLRDDVARLRLTTGMPVAVGFGISRRQHLQALAGAADGAVVGSALVRCIEEAGGNEVSAARRLVRELLGKED